ncbi:hypothetical protein ACWEOZ_18620 [Actinoplanes sp. NPDC004185]
MAEAVRIALAAADGKNVEVLSADIGRRRLDRGLIDEIDLCIAPVLLVDGIRLYDHVGGRPVHLHRVGADDPTAEVDVRYRPAARVGRPGPARRGLRQSVRGPGPILGTNGQATDLLDDRRPQCGGQIDPMGGH